MTAPRLINKTFAELQADPGGLLNKVANAESPVVIRRRGAKPIVMMPLSEWNGWHETFYLTATDANRRALDESIAQLESGQIVVTDWGEDGNLHPVEPDGAARR